MTQAFNLSQLANLVNTSGQLNAATGLYNQTPVANGGTGVASVASGNILVGADTAAMTPLAGSSAGDVVTWDGTAWVSAVSGGGSVQTYLVRTSPGTWTKPATVKGIKVTVVGGGGNGGAATKTAPTPGTPTNAYSGGGGGGGAAIRVYPAASLPGPQPYTVGGAGATSSFGVAPASVTSATGGASGAVVNTGYQVGAAGGSGSGGTLNCKGSPGMFSAGTFTGLGGSSIYGGGANTQAPTPGYRPGLAGQAYGGGGSGGAFIGQTTTVSTAPGGAGENGVVIIEEFY